MISKKAFYSSLVIAFAVVLLVNANAFSGLSVLSALKGSQSIGPLSEVGSESLRPPPLNILLIVLDDWGVDGLDTPGLALGSDLPHTPTLNALAQSGIVFPEMWTNALCCPSRASMLTGRYSFQNGIGEVLDNGNPGDFDFQLNEITIPEMLTKGTLGRYRSAAFGKWHLSYDPNNPNLQGFSYYAGSLWNLNGFNPATNVYYNYPRTVNGVTAQVQNYATTQTVDDAITWLNTNANHPFFVYLAFNAPHTPYHVPPSGLYYQTNLPSNSECTDPPNRHICWKAAVEAADTELGRLLQSLPSDVRARTMIFVTGDNGTSERVILPPHSASRGKGTLYEEGIRVPLIVNGPLVTSPGAISPALINSTDFFATFAQITKVNLYSTSVIPSSVTLNSKSFLGSILNPLAPSKRQYALSELFSPNGYGEGYPKPAPPVPFYQEELPQYQGPGTSHLQVCCDFLDLGNSSDIILSGAPPNANVQIYFSGTDNQAPLYGGVVISTTPDEILTGQTDASGSLVLSDGIFFSLEDPGPSGFFIQAIIDDPAQSQSYQLSNAVRVEVNDESNIKAVRNQCYKLIISMNGNPQHEELYDLCSDRFEQNDLLANGPLTPGSAEQTSYTDLKTRLNQWLTP